MTMVIMMTMNKKKKKMMMLLPPLFTHLCSSSSHFMDKVPNFTWKWKVSLHARRLVSRGTMHGKSCQATCFLSCKKIGKTHIWRTNTFGNELGAVFCFVNHIHGKIKQNMKKLTIIFNQQPLWPTAIIVTYFQVNVIPVWKSSAMQCNWFTETFEQDLYDIQSLSQTLSSQEMKKLRCDKVDPTETENKQK